jgi:hypothetical protein
MAMYVSINGHTIRANAVHGTDNPPIRVARGKHDRKPVYASEIEISGPCRLVYSPDKPVLKCGARLVLEADDVRIVR